MKIYSSIINEFFVSYIIVKPCKIADLIVVHISRLRAHRINTDVVHLNAANSRCRNAISEHGFRHHELDAHRLVNRSGLSVNVEEKGSRLANIRRVS